MKDKDVKERLEELLLLQHGTETAYKFSQLCKNISFEDSYTSLLKTGNLEILSRIYLLLFHPRKLRTMVTNLVTEVAYNEHKEALFDGMNGRIKSPHEFEKTNGLESMVEKLHQFKDCHETETAPILHEVLIHLLRAVRVCLSNNDRGNESFKHYLLVAFPYKTIVSRTNEAYKRLLELKTAESIALREAESMARGCR